MWVALAAATPSDGFASRSGSGRERGIGRVSALRPVIAILASVLVVLAALGVALAALGALVLLRYPDRPGGNVRLLGLEVNSIGAGLPLIALGVLAVAVSVIQQSQQSDESTQSSDAGGRVDPLTASAGADAPGCMAEFFETRPKVPSDRRRFLPRRSEWITVLKSGDSKSAEFGLVLKDDGKSIGAIKMRYNSDGDEFNVDGVIDSRCNSVGWMAERDPATPSPSTIAFYDHLILPLGRASYGIRFNERVPETSMELTGG